MRKLNAKIKVTQNDSECEFKLLMAHLQQVILQRVTYPNTFQYNGVMECRHRCIMGKVMALLLSTHMQIFL